VKKVYVIEELDPFFETEIRAMGYKVFHGRTLSPTCTNFHPRSSKLLKAKSIQGPKIREKPENLPRRPPNLCGGLFPQAALLRA